jgi:Ca-activated chloride channel homolog
MSPSIVPWLLGGGVLLGAARQQPPVFRGGTENVPVFVTVTDKDGRLVTTLAREDFVLLDNGRQQPVAVFDNAPQPIRLVVMLDVSGSMYGNLQLLRSATAELIARLRPDDKVRLGSFGADITISPAFTTDRARLEAALPTAIPESAPTPLWSALDKALDAFSQDSGRPVILVLSDGKDSGAVRFGQPFFTLVQVMDRAQREGVMIYAVGLRSRSAPGRAPAFGMGALTGDFPDPGLSKLALETGGGYFEIRPSDDLPATFAQVVDELHAQYLLGFAPPERDGKRHKVDVRVLTKGDVPRARKSYVAPH